MTTLLVIGACLGVGSIGSGIALVRVADNPPAANLGILAAGAGVTLLGVVGVVQLARML